MVCHLVSVTAVRAAGHRRIGRRTALTGFGAALLLGGCGRPGPASGPVTRTPTPAARATLVDDTWDSAAARRRITATVSLPDGADPRTLYPIIALHGLGGDHASALRAGLVDSQRAVIDAGSRPFAAVSVDGGGYYHPRVSGDDHGAMVLTELLDRLGRRLDTSRVGFVGFSMGGYGALLLGSMLGPERCPAVAAASPAVWVPGDTPARGAFDGPADYRTWSLFNRVAELTRIPCRIEASRSDPFRSADRRLADLLKKAGGQVETSFDDPGDHSDGWWGSILPKQLAFCAGRI